MRSPWPTAERELLLGLAQHSGIYGGLAECIGPAGAGEKSPFRPTCDSAVTVTETLLARAQAAGWIRRMPKHLIQW
jgi:hypothetical protein